MAEWKVEIGKATQVNVLSGNGHECCLQRTNSKGKILTIFSSISHISLKVSNGYKKSCREEHFAQKRVTFELEIFMLLNVKMTITSTEGELTKLKNPKSFPETNTSSL